MELEVRNGDATQPAGEGTKIIVHVCNDVGAWGKGFVLALSRRWKAPEKAFRAWYAAGTEAEAGPFRLGAVQFVQVEEGLVIANVVGQHRLKAIDGVPPIRYPALEEGLETIANKAKELSASVHMPRIGCGLAGGTWARVGAIVETKLLDAGVPTTVYDWG